VAATRISEEYFHRLAAAKQVLVARLEHLPYIIGNVLLYQDLAPLRNQAVRIVVQCTRPTIDGRHLL